MSSGRMVSAREIVGKRIVRFTYDVDLVKDRGTIHSNVQIHLDDGSFLYFRTEETDDEYGTYVGRVVPA